MRHGFTTGSCAAAAAKAAAWMLLFDTVKTEISITTPKGIVYTPQVLDICREAKRVSCAIRKDSGDDPDVTNGVLVYAEVSLEETLAEVCDETGPAGVCAGDKEAAWSESAQAVIRIDGGKGVGRVTKPGLDQPVGAAAINHVPREMIRAELQEVCAAADYRGGLAVVISVPEGERLAEQTFNPRLGIVGGISIIGTTGIVEPMSNQALLDTIRVELKQRRALGFDHVAITPGNYGKDYMKRTWNYDLDRSVPCSNFIGDTIDMAIELGYRKLLLTGHIGKLVKLAGGMLNTHSKLGDCRMELLCASAIRMGAGTELLKRLLDCVVTEEALRLLQGAGLLESVMEHLMERIMTALRRRAKGAIEIEAVMYSNEFGELARSKGAEEWLILLAQEQEQQI